ncbi:MAG: YbhB/YbcL family Raf kinase inhibitor-like protein [Betaproteobacteria bacterium]|nr:YbhB/YbcL family Raf kinase inhibitor-like protein [Betaproteobacteria bacterium]
MSLTLTSPSFRPGESIPKEYTCDGADRSPPLAWSGTPADTKTLALVLEDPDAPGGTWVHWVLYNIPARVHALEANVPHHPVLADGARQGLNSWPKTGYGGPCPPSGTHHYWFHLYALDTLLDLKTPTQAQLLDAMKGHILAEAELMGTYRRH